MQGWKRHVASKVVLDAMVLVQHAVGNERQTA